MDTEVDQKSFLEELENIDLMNFLLCPVNVPLVTFFAGLKEQTEREFAISWCTNRGDRSLRIPRGRDLNGVKHYNHRELGAYTHDTTKKFIIGKNLNGRILRGQIHHGLGTKDVTIKTFDIAFPAGGISLLHPKRLRNEIELLTQEPLRSNPYVAKLIGYSIDKTLAVVYDLKSNKSLRTMLESADCFGWDDRLAVAVQVAQLIETLHAEDFIIGSIDPANIVIDEEDNIKLCEFGVQSLMQEIRYHPWKSTCGIYGHGLPKRSSDVGWTKEADIYCFGCLLVELVTKEQVLEVAKTLEGCFVKREWVSKRLMNCKISPVDKSLTDDEIIGQKITELVMNCLSNDPDQRYPAKIVVEKLKGLVTYQESSASKKPKLA